MLPTVGRTHLGEKDQGGTERTASNGEQPAAGLGFRRRRRGTTCCAQGRRATRAGESLGALVPSGAREDAGAEEEGDDEENEDDALEADGAPPTRFADPAAAFSGSARFSSFSGVPARADAVSAALLASFSSGAVAFSAPTVSYSAATTAAATTGTPPWAGAAMSAFRGVRAAAGEHHERARRGRVGARGI